MSLTNKVILITGGTGSFGQKFIEIAWQEHNPEVIRIFSRGKVVNCTFAFHGLQTWEVSG